MRAEKYTPPVPGNHPLAVGFLAALVLYGIGGLLTGALRQESSSAGLLPFGVRLLWYTLLITSASLCLIGIYLREPPGLLVERFGQILLGTQLVAYGAAVMVLGEVSTIRSGVIFTVAGLPAFWRAAQLTRYIRQWPLTYDIRRTLEEILRTIEVLNGRSR